MSMYWRDVIFGIGALTLIGGWFPTLVVGAVVQSLPIAIFGATWLIVVALLAARTPWSD